MKCKNEFIFKGFEFKYKRKHFKNQNLTKCKVKRKIRASVMDDELLITVHYHKYNKLKNEI